MEQVLTSPRVERRFVCDSCDKTLCRSESTDDSAASSEVAPCERWISLTRPGYDLCGACFWKPGGGLTMLRDGHGFMCLRGAMARIRFKDALARNMLSAAEPAESSTEICALCDSCDVRVEGIWVRCAVCLEFDLCEGCFALELCSPRHATGHPFAIFWQASHATVTAAISAVRRVIAQPDPLPPVVRAHVGFGESGDALWEHLVAIERLCFGAHAWSALALRRHANPHRNYFIDYMGVAELACVAYVAFKFVRDRDSGEANDEDSDESSGAEEDRLCESVAAILSVGKRAFETCLVTSLAVHPAFEHRGFGTRLLRHVLHQARMRTVCHRVRLHVRVDNHRAVALYVHHGFCVVCVDRGYYGATVDAFEMELWLAPRTEAEPN